MPEGGPVPPLKLSLRPSAVITSPNHPMSSSRVDQRKRRKPCTRDVTVQHNVFLRNSSPKP
eukprot:1031274-Alexandrium_andersonii.AAC.1